jgi:hypothetical protein
MDTGSSKTNGHFKEGHPSGITGLVAAHPGNIVVQQTVSYEASAPMTDVVALYRYFEPVGRTFRADASLSRITEVVVEVISLLRAARTVADEISRENEVSVALGRLAQLLRHGGSSATFDEFVNLLLVAVNGHRGRPYAFKELVALEGALELLERSPTPSEDAVDAAYDSLQKAGFDINAPLKGVEVNDE